MVEIDELKFGRKVSMIMVSCTILSNFDFPTQTVSWQKKMSTFVHSVASRENILLFSSIVLIE